MTKRDALTLADLLDQLTECEIGAQAAAELRRLHDENTALRKCALKYLDYLRIPNQEKALEADLKAPEMLE